MADIQKLKAAGNYTVEVAMQPARNQLTSVYSNDHQTKSMQDQRTL